MWCEYWVSVQGSFKENGMNNISSMHNFDDVQSKNIPFFN